MLSFHFSIITTVPQTKALHTKYCFSFCFVLFKVEIHCYEIAAPLPVRFEGSNQWGFNWTIKFPSSFVARWLFLPLSVTYSVSLQTNEVIRVSDEPSKFLKTHQILVRQIQILPPANHLARCVQRYWCVKRRGVSKKARYNSHRSKSRRIDGEPAEGHTHFDHLSITASSMVKVG